MKFICHEISAPRQALATLPAFAAVFVLYAGSLQAGENNRRQTMEPRRFDLFAEQKAPSRANIHCGDSRYKILQRVEGKFLKSQSPDLAESLKFPGKDGLMFGDGVSQAPAPAFMWTPDVGLKVDNGWLLGVDRGEWEGELVFVDKNKRRSQLLDQNVLDIFQLGGAIIALTGMRHLSTEEGFVFKITRNIGGTWRASRWKILPGYPEGAFALADGRILVICDGGAVLLSENGLLEKADCDIF